MLSAMEIYDRDPPVLIARTTGAKNNLLPFGESGRRCPNLFHPCSNKDPAMPPPSSFFPLSKFFPNHPPLPSPPPFSFLLNHRREGRGGGGGRQRKENCNNPSLDQRANKAKGPWRRWDHPWPKLPLKRLPKPGFTTALFSHRGKEMRFGLLFLEVLPPPLPSMESR